MGWMLLGSLLAFVAGLMLRHRKALELWVAKYFSLGELLIMLLCLIFLVAVMADKVLIRLGL